MQIQPGKDVLGRAEHTAPTRQHEQDHTDQGSICPERRRSWKGKSTICPICEVFGLGSRFDTWQMRLAPSKEAAAENEIVFISGFGPGSTDTMVDLTVHSNSSIHLN